MSTGYRFCFGAVAAVLAVGPVGAIAADPPDKGAIRVPLSPPPIDRTAPASPEPLRGAIRFSETIQRALSRNAGVQIQALQVRASEGSVLQSRGSYDPEFTARTERQAIRRPLAANETADLAAAGAWSVREEEGWNTNYRAGVERLFESGARAEAGVSVSATGSNAAALRGIPQQTTASLRFQLRVPLQRNAGGIQQAATLRASELERDASVEDLVQTSAGVVLATAQAYWELAARLRRIEILRASERSASNLVGELRQLIDADQIPAAELNLALASESEKRAARAAEEQQLQQVWSTLGRLLDADARDAFASGAATDPLPPIDDRLPAAAAAIEQRIAAVLDLRADLRSARLRERSAYELLRSAQDGLKPQLDMILGATTNGLAEGTSSLALGNALDLRGRDPVLNVALELRWPIRNDTAYGALITRMAGHDQATLRVRELERSIGPGIVNTITALRRTVERYRQIETAAERYAVSVSNERTKRRLGLSTLIDIINVQDRLDGAQLALLQLRQEYASLVAQLHFDSGTIVLRERDSYHVDVARLQGAAPPEVPR